MSLFWYLCFLITIASAQQIASNAGPDPVQNFCMRWWSQSVVKNDILYIYSGAQKYNDSGDLYFGAINYMMTIDMSTSWDWKASSNKPEYLNMTTELTNVTNPSTGTSVPNVFRGHMFHGPDNTTDIYRYGGTTYMFNRTFVGKTTPDSSIYPLWKYSPASSGFKWNQYNIGQLWMPNHGAGAEATDLGLGFYLNGQIDMGTSTKTLGKIIDYSQETYVPLEGMVVMDLVNTGKQAANLSTAMMRGNHPRTGGTMEYIAPVGSTGILVALGGQMNPTVTEGVASRSTGELIDFSSVDVFDLGSYLSNTTGNGTWYRQNTTGHIPPPRIDFCSVSISAPDNSSHHIYIYGGYNPTISNSSYDDVIVLSLPSFEWTSVYPVGESPRKFHKCHIAGKRQMITVGGNITNKCDWERKGVAVFDMTSLIWGSVFTANATAYQVPTTLLPATGGTENGRATIGEPKADWTDQGLKTVFAKSRWTVPTTWKPNPAKLPGTSNPATSADKSINTGAIAGGVVGGCIAILILTSLFFYRRRLTKRAELDANTNTVTTPYPELECSKIEKYELQGINENNPAELPGDIVGVEADYATATTAAELPGPNTGVPIVRTPGDDLPEVPEYMPGLRGRSRSGSRERRRSRSRSGGRGGNESATTRDGYF